MMNRRLLVFALFLLLPGARASAATLYVAPNGDDRWSGRARTPNADRTDGPLASLKGARAAVRRLKAVQRAPVPVHVVFAGGTYTLDAEVRFTPEDSGTAAAPVTYEAAKGERPVFTGGRAITGFRADSSGVWKAKVPGVAEGKWTFGQLFVNGRRAVRARTPNKFYHYMARGVGYGIDPLTNKPARLTNRAFVARPADIQPLLKLPPKQLRDVVLVAYHSWAVSLLRPASVDRKTNVVITTGPARWPFLRWGPSQRYHLENFREALDAPGEWFLDREGWLHYLPREGEDMTTARVVAPVLSTFVSFAGEPKLDRWVEHVTFRALSFQHGRYVVPPEGISDAQAAVTIPGVIMADGARHVALEDCEVAHVGTYAVWFRRSNRHCRVERCFIHDLGAGGVRMGEGWDNDNPAPGDVTSHTVVDNNIIRDGGHLFRGTHGVWIGHSSDNRVTHNDIADFRYTGISVGWRWLYNRPSVAKRNTIDFNHIHHIGWGVMSDMGGVYTLGQSEGTTVSNNVIHDVYSYDRYGRGGWGLYNDQASTHIVMENNLVYRVKTGCYHLHFGRHLTIRNNIFAFSMDGQIQHSKTDPQHPSFAAFERNVFYWDDGPVHSRSRWEDRSRFRANLYHCTTSSDPVFWEGLRFKQWQAKGEDEGSILADPMFVDPKRGDFRLQPGSPAEKIGFKPFDYTKAGVYGDPAWVRTASEATYPPVEFAPAPPPAPPLTFSEDFEAVPVGGAPIRAKVYGAEKGARVAVTAGAVAQGKHCLAVTDQAGLPATYNPHFYYQPNHTKGITRLAFDIRLSADSQVHHEWRDASKPYQVGPSLRIADGKMHVRGKAPLPMPTGKWVHVEIAAGMGPDSTGTWDLTVTVPGQAPVKYTKLPYGRGRMATLQWLGFSSLATKRTVYHLDNIKLTRK